MDSVHGMIGRTIDRVDKDQQKPTEPPLKLVAVFTQAAPLWVERRRCNGVDAVASAAVPAAVPEVEIR
ncbi:MAG: hypothetical protein ACYDFT_05195 [Thermoplasmata archaeon]